jgi:hypothetical protein
VSLSRKHFVALADIVADIVDNEGTIDAKSLALRLADWCASENGRFDRERFLVACLGTDGRGNYGRPDPWRHDKAGAFGTFAEPDS